MAEQMLPNELILLIAKYADAKTRPIILSLNKYLSLYRYEMCLFKLDYSNAHYILNYYGQDVLDYIERTQKKG